MIVTVEGVGDFEVDPGTPLADLLATAASPAAVWCGATALDGTHRAGVAPLTHAALLSTAPEAAPSAAHQPRLRAVAGPDAGLVMTPTTREETIGRAAGWRLADPRLSRRHLGIDSTGRIRDLGSRNGSTLVRGGRRSRLGRRRRRLRQGDLVVVGGTRLRWESGKPRDDDRRPEDAPQSRGRELARRASAIIAVAGGAVTLALATGRWAIALIAVVAPLAGLAATVSRRRHLDTPVGIERLSDAPLPVAIVGTAAEVRGAARALALATSAALEPPHREPWMRWLPATLGPRAVTSVAPDAPAPTEARTVIDVPRATLTVDGVTEQWPPALVSARTGDREARRAIAREPEGLPTEVRWSEIAGAAEESSPNRRRLAAVVGLTAHGPLRLDLDRDGPHVLVAGTTGAGKSLLLETLVSAIALHHRPEALGIGLIDLKGGTGLGPCRSLPHVRGVLTDLEPALARRALLGIAHELRERKRALASRGLESWVAWERRGDAPARMLVVVDEFQELGTLDSGLVPELTRLAAQGRALGMHLVLATQRPAGAVTPEIRANVGTILALRTATASESHDLLGDGAAASLAPVPGRGIAATPRARVEFQAALPLAERRPPVRRLGHAVPAGPRLADAARAGWSSPPTAQPLWRAPLDRVTAPPPDGIGWVDVPAERRREPLRWHPSTGPCVIVGPRGSGRTTVLAALARSLGPCVVLPGEPREAARTLAMIEEAGAGPLLIDDADRIVPALEGAMRGAEHVLEALSRRTPVALAAGPGWGTRWASRAGLRIVLAGLDRVEQTLWGVPPSLVGLQAHPGRGVAIGPGVSGECAVAAASMPPNRRLVEPLDPDAEVPTGAVGSVGDHAAPLVLPTDGVLVVGTPGRERDRALASLRASGIDASVSERIAPADVVLLIGGASAVRSHGLVPPPGVCEDRPPPGRITVLRAGVLEAGVLRRPA